MSKFFIRVLAGLIVFFPFSVLGQTRLISGDDNLWRYLDVNQRPSGWETAAYSDTASWKTGAAPLGYGYTGLNTVVSYGASSSSKYITTYFRKNINISSLQGISSFTLNLQYDDGAVIYVNGTEVARTNILAAAVITQTRLADTSVSSTSAASRTFIIDKSFFNAGINVIAIEMHQSSASSSDLYFNLTLTANNGLSRGPYLQVGSQTGITFRWRTETATTGKVQVGTNIGDYTTAITEESVAGTEHILRISGLQPDTKYYYRIGNTDGTVLQGDAYNFFKTNPQSTTSRKIRVSVFGDCGRGNASYQDGTLSAYRNMLNTGGIDAPDAFILLGDNAYTSGTDEEYTSNFFNIYGDNILKNHKMYPAPGNHDYGNSHANDGLRNLAYHQTFSVPQNGESGGFASGKQNYYSYDLGNIHFISLDSYGTESDYKSMQSSGNTQIKTWVQNDLAANTKKWVIVYWHHPPFTQGSYDSDGVNDGVSFNGNQELYNIQQNFMTFLYDLGVDMVLSGHSHVFERSYLLRKYTGPWASFNKTNSSHAASSSNGIYSDAASCPFVYNSNSTNHGTVYVVSGSSGASTSTTKAKFGTGPMPHAFNQAAFFYFEVEDNRLDAKAINTSGTIIDKFTIIKDVNKSASYDLSAGQSINLSASWPAATYKWIENSINETTSSRTKTIAYGPSGSARLISVTDSFGCITDQFTINSIAVVPVQVKDFQLFKRDHAVSLSWITGSESNNSHFTIEWSKNGYDFTRKGIVQGKGNSSTTQQYTWTDLSPQKGKNIYRLSQTDLDGKNQILGIKGIFFGSIDNASVNQLQVEQSSYQMKVEENGMYRIAVYDITGRLMFDHQTQVNDNYIAGQFNLSPGIFQWVITGKQGILLSQQRKH